ncbi:MAG: FMN-binding protein [Bacillota bacterium]
MKRVLAVTVLVAITALLLVGCKPLTYKDGTFEAYSIANDKGYVWARVTIAKDKITAVELKEYDAVGLEKDWDIYAYPQTKDAIAALKKAFVDKNSAKVDVVTGATSTSTKAMEAVAFALEKALAKPTATTKYFNGTFMAISDTTERGWGIAWVTIENDKITKVELHGTQPRRDAAGNVVKDAKGRTVFIRKVVEGADRYAHEPFHTARLKIAQDIVAKGSPQVDTVSGATGSSKQWMQAVERALQMARR